MRLPVREKNKKQNIINEKQIHTMCLCFPVEKNSYLTQICLMVRIFTNEYRQQAYIVEGSNSMMNLWLLYSD